MKTMKILITMALIILMSNVASAAIEENWAYGERNYVTENITIESVVYDFEEGSNCGTFKNQYPDIAEFLNVSGTRPYGLDIPSYSRVGGSMCGKTRCKMHIYPYPNTYYNGTPMPWIYIVNGKGAFNSITGPDIMGGYWPGTKAEIATKEDTQYISFLVSTGGTMYVNLYDRRGNRLHSEKVYVNYHRTGTEPSNFTRVSVHLPNSEIRSMTISGMFNGWHIDDLIIGGAPGYLPDKPVDYTDVARLAEELYGVRYLEYGLGHDYVTFDYLEPWQFHYPYVHEYWNPELKEFELGEGISDEGLIVWAYNTVTKELYGENVVKWSTVEGMMKHDFKVPVESADTVPGDVYFMDHDFDEKPDWVGMVVEETPTGMNLIGSYPGISEGENIGVIYSKKSIVESSPAFMGYKRLPGVIKGGHNPIPKGH